jgi:hypothetical protein
VSKAVYVSARLGASLRDVAKSDGRSVHPHEPIVELSENLWCVQGDVPGAPIKRRMTIAKRVNGDLIVHNAMLLRKADMKRIDAWGEVRYVVVPNGWHRLDAPAFADRYPDAEIVCPRGSTKRVEEKVRVDLSYADIPDDEHVSFEHLDGTKELEGVMKVHSEDGTTLVFNDVLFNITGDVPGLAGVVLELIGSTGGAKVTNIARLIVVKEARELRGHLERLAQPDVVRLIPGHGDIVERDADEVLYRTAVRL